MENCTMIKDGMLWKNKLLIRVSEEPVGKKAGIIKNYLRAWLLLNVHSIKSGITFKAAVPNFFGARDL